jgi:DNA-binding NtrC family response regulator/serine/threonine protein kinase
VQRVVPHATLSRHLRVVVWACNPLISAPFDLAHNRWDNGREPWNSRVRLFVSHAPLDRLRFFAQSRAVTVPPHLPRRYRLLEPLGAGGEGSVWRALDRYRDRDVALKVVETMGGGARERLSQEFLVLSRLVHPNISRVLDYGILEGGTLDRGIPDERLTPGAYYTSELARGGNLLEWTGKAGGNWAVFLSLVFEALAALDYLSRQGIYHGDVKPGNLLLDHPGDAGVPHLRVIDFGAARIQHTAEPGGLGTPAYLPGPALLGSPLDTELYGLGMTLFHAAAGRLPFRLGSAEVLAWQERQETARLERIVPDAPTILCELVDRLTTYKHTERFRSCAEALGFLNTRVPTPAHSRRRRPPDPEVVSRAYEPVLDELCDCVAGATGRLDLQCLSVPHERAVVPLLAQLAARLQVHGVRCVTFLGVGDTGAQEQLAELAEDIAEAPLPPSPSEESFALELVSRLEGVRLAILLAEPELVPENTPLTDGTVRAESAILPALLPFLRAPDGRCRIPLVVATTGVERTLARLGAAGTALTVRSFEPLEANSIRRVLRESFCVEEVPDHLVESVLGASDGLPHLVEEAVRALAGAGVSSDCLGQLHTPEKLPQPLVRPRPTEALWLSVEGEMRGALGLLAAAGDALSVRQVEVAFQDLPAADIVRPADAEGWRNAFEGLRTRALVRQDGLGETARYSAFIPAGSTAVRDLLGERQERAVYEHLAGSFAASPRRGSPRALEAASHHLLCLGRGREAARWALAASRSLRRRGRLGEALRVLGALHSPAGRSGPAAEVVAESRATGLVRLRAADLLVTCGRHREALDLLEERHTPTDPEWLVWHSGCLRARAYEQAGERAAAIAELEQLVAQSASFVDNERLPVQLELQARLVPLFYAEGKTALAQEAGESCRQILAAQNWSAARPARVARALGFAAAVEARYGGAETASELFTKALALGRVAGRRELVQGTLNELAIFYAGRQKWSAALRVFQESQEIAEEATDRWTALKAIYNRAIAYYRLDDLGRAEELFREARTRSDALGRHSFSAAVWSGLAGVLREQGRLREALRLYRRVLRLPAAVCRPNDRAVAHNNLADLYLSFGRLAKALSQAETALTIATETGNRFLLTVSLRTRGKVDLALGNLDPAQVDLEASLVRARESDDHRNLAAVHYYLGVLHSRSGQTAESWRHLRLSSHESRIAAHGTYRRAARLALASALLAVGRRRLAHRIGATLSAEPGAQRGSVAAAVLRARARDDWPAAAEKELREIDRSARRHGVAWESFLALRDAASDSSLSTRQSVEVAYLAAAHGRALLAGAPEANRASMAAFWGLANEPAPTGDEGSSPGEARGSAVDFDEEASTFDDAGLVELLGGDVESLSLQAFLEACRRALRLRSLALVFDPLNESRPAELTAAVESAGSLTQLPTGPIERARERSEPILALPFIAMRLTGRERSRVLCAELESNTPLATQSAAGAVRQVSRLALLCSVFLRLEELGGQLKAESQRYEEVRAELRSLHADASKGGKDLETAVLSQRLEILELRGRVSFARDRSALRSPIGRSQAMERIIKQLPALAARELPVIILGETGVGKDLIAQWIHYLSARGDRPYVSELCNLAESLAEAELFGFVAGAFTGAISDRPGIFQLADGGSLYLDEVSSLSATMQARILRVLEEKQVRPVGATSLVPVDCRILSSSRLSREELEEDSVLRSDLLYRLNTEVIEIPPLRERPEDIPLLAAGLLEFFAKERGLAPPYVHSNVYRRLSEYSWPGNVRELENELQRALARNPLEISAADVLSSARPTGQGPAGSLPLPTLQDERRRAEAGLVRRALEFHAGNATQAAKALGITRRYLGTLLERYEITLRDFKNGSS